MDSETEPTFSRALSAWLTAPFVVAVGIAVPLALNGEHPELGTVTMRQLLATWVVHDVSHIAQITRTMAREYTEAVGPWTRYFRVLQRDVRQ